MSFPNGHVNTLLRKRTNSSRRLQKPRQVRGLPSEAPGGLRLENNPSPLLCADTGSEGLRAAGDRYQAGDEGRPLPAPGPSRLGQERGCAGSSISPRAAERALPQPRPRSPRSPAGRPRPPPAHPAPSSARDHGRRRGLLPPPHLPRCWDLPGRGARAARTCPHQQYAFPAKRAKGH